MGVPKRATDGLEIQEPIGIDFDGVITDNAVVKSKLFNEIGYNIDPKETDRWYCVDELGIPEEDYNEVSKQANLLLHETPLREGVTSGLKHLLDHGYTPVVVSSRYESETADMVEYIKEKNLPIEWYLYTSREPKDSALRKIGAIAHIDDSYYKIENMISESRDSPCDLLFFRHPSNAHIESTHNIVSEVNGWGDVIKYFDHFD